MDLAIKFEMNEIEQVPELSHYNYIVWRFKSRTIFGITHFVEKYDDVSETPEYRFMKQSGVHMLQVTSGYGDPVPTDRLGFGGVWVEVDITRPDLLQLSHD